MALPNLVKTYIDQEAVYAKGPDPSPTTECWMSIIKLPKIKTDENGLPYQYLVRYMEVDKQRVIDAYSGDDLDYQDSEIYIFSRIHTEEDLEQLLRQYLPDLSVIGSIKTVPFPFG